MNRETSIYAFAFRGLLANEALDALDRETSRTSPAAIEHQVEKRVSIDRLPEEAVSRARRMATVYVAVTAFESTVRELVAQTLLEKYGENWWKEKVSDGIRTKAESRREEENKVRWHTPRGDAIINYTEFGDLTSVILQNWSDFEDLLQSVDWVKGIIKPLERSRNVVMHGGDLQEEDIERVGVAIRDWVRQGGRVTNGLLHRFLIRESGMLGNRPHIRPTNGDDFGGGLGEGDEGDADDSR